MSDNSFPPALIKPLCDFVELPPRDVAEIVIEPRAVRFIVFKTNENGKKYVVDGEAARYVLTFPVDANGWGDL